jgi:hypothetical protein
MKSNRFIGGATGRKQQCGTISAPRTPIPYGRPDVHKELNEKFGLSRQPAPHKALTQHASRASHA